MSSAKVFKTAPPLRQVVSFYFSLGAGGDQKGAERELKLDFEPETVIVRQVTWSGLGAVSTTTAITASFASDECLASISGAADGTATPGTTFFFAKKPQRTKFSFPQNGTMTATTLSANVILTLEFCA